MFRLILDKLDEGESESIVLASELKADYIILDEKLARRKAGLLGLPVIGTLGILLISSEKCRAYSKHIDFVG
jgi:predicted nucleic acid-binding protein